MLYFSLSPSLSPLSLLFSPFFLFLSSFLFSFSPSPSLFSPSLSLFLSFSSLFSSFPPLLSPLSSLLSLIYYKKFQINDWTEFFLSLKEKITVTYKTDKWTGGQVKKTRVAKNVKVLQRTYKKNLNLSNLSACPPVHTVWYHYSFYFLEFSFSLNPIFLKMM
jgi:hypothetical protein